MAMSVYELSLLCSCIFIAATLYSSVGHAGASGYLAAMAAFAIAPDVMKPTALVLNIMVASLASYRLYRAGLVDWRTLWPFVITSVPMAYWAGTWHVTDKTYRMVLGVVVLVSAVRLLVFPSRTANDAPKTTAPEMSAPEMSTPETAAPQPPLVPASLSGGAIGIISGLTGTGGGVFLSPVLIFAKWASTRQSTGITAPFILVNSMAGLAGGFKAGQGLPTLLPYLVLPALMGGLLGTHLGIKRLSSPWLQRLLGVVLLIAAGKFIAT